MDEDADELSAMEKLLEQYKSTSVVPDKSRVQLTGADVAELYALTWVKKGWSMLDFRKLLFEVSTVASVAHRVDAAKTFDIVAKQPKSIRALGRLCAECHKTNKPANSPLLRARVTQAEGASGGGCCACQARDRGLRLLLQVSSAPHTIRIA
jgi:hypothetical protein